MAIEKSFYYGRSLLKDEINSLSDETFIRDLCQEPAFTIKKNKSICSRCGTGSNMSRRFPCVCGGNCLYCRECIALGKVRECAHLYSLPEPNHFEKHGMPYLHWEGQLSDQQARASELILRSVENHRETIVWAVAGAGKTEMLFRGIQYALENNKRVCIASPRIDVCLELAPRLQRVFPDVPAVVLYGGTEEPYRYTQLVVSTTHQLYRFKEAFDVLIIDEVDAFPYRLNDALHFATERSRKKQSCLIYLTATPDHRMQKRIRDKQIEAVVLPARYHGHALPVPKAVYHAKDILNNKKVKSTPLIKHMSHLIEQKKRFLLFMPEISLMIETETLLLDIFSEASFECVHAKDGERKGKVLKMRNGELDFLVTTTILERGVTFENIDVLIWRADHPVYTEAALVQISGRAGRSKVFPTGNVTFYYRDWTRSMKKALKQIREMNSRARKNGLIQ